VHYPSEIKRRRKPNYRKVMRNRNNSTFLLVALASIVFIVPANAFLSTVHPSLPSTGDRVTGTQLFEGGGLFGNKNPLRNIFGGKEESGPKVVVDIPAKGVKIGALRFLLQIHLVGEQNNPQPQTWLMKEGEDGELDVYFNDGTGMFSLDLNEYSVKITRYGEKPSLQYQIQESVLLHSILDELHKTAFEVDDDIEEEKRLLRLNDENAIEAARSKLLARAA
jgi:hypothetical protein